VLSLRKQPDGSAGLEAVNHEVGLDRSSFVAARCVWVLLCSAPGGAQRVVPSCGSMLRPLIR